MRRVKLPPPAEWFLRGFFLGAGATAFVLLLSSAVGALARVWGLLHG